MHEASDLRVSDAERERAAAAIREHYAAGRLDTEEFETRLQSVYAARTERELSALQVDLPALASEQTPIALGKSPSERAELAARRADLHRRVLHRAGGGVGAFALSTVVWALTGTDGSFWPEWVLVAVVLSVVRPIWNLWGPAPDLDRVEQDLNRRRGSRRRLRP